MNIRLFLLASALVSCGTHVQAMEQYRQISPAQHRYALAQDNLEHAYASGNKAALPELYLPFVKALRDFNEPYTIVSQLLISKMSYGIAHLPETLAIFEEALGKLDLNQNRSILKGLAYRNS